jgi:CheY-like chemotaxis protein
MAYLLLVDDNDFNLFILEQIVSDAGHQYKLSMRGEEAIEFAKSEVFDLVFMDIHMPTPDGIECTKRIRQIYSMNELPIVGLSGEVDRTIIQDARNAGMNDFLSKPYKSSTLLEYIDRFTKKN